MDDKPDNLPAQPDLAAAIRQARVENAERAEAIAEMRELEMGRLTALESALRPIVDRAPPDVDLFDLALAPGEHPRLFLDMIAFVDMGHDRRTYRFYQDTRHGRVLIAESQSTDAMGAAVADYVARRLVERERALAADWRVDGAPQPKADGPRAAESQSADAIAAMVADYVERRLADRERALAADGAPQPQPEAGGSRAWPIAKSRTLAWPPPGAPEAMAAADEPKARPRRGFVAWLGDALSLLLMILGSLTLALFVGLGADLAWTTRLRDLWAQWIGAPPF